MVDDPGSGLYEWETRWAELQDAIDEDAAQALPEVVRFVGDMLRERGYDLEEPVTAEGDDFDMIKDYLAAGDLAAAAEQGSADPEDIDVALDDLREIYEYISEDRGPP
jgi:hypothetical protein